ncbi:hypothetical protein OXPF_13410 [Oxobacter pfennigii]|uniref:Uncharacterized protein n=1 Tax=Oxobacter pfennigii TaxID=36849 RepID=A0A0P8WAW3_9CLOT|nr:hypothetical protein [Oxobacter pfennigii]KPU44863.1 hypothetical protein OXPF_13410 [Oxobacter pfennigii]
MILIDDAGSGSLVGGTLIGLLRVETKEFYSEVIPIKLYNQNNFEKKHYLSYTTDIVKRAFKHLNVEKDENVHICRGYMFDDVRKYFAENNILYEDAKIEDPLQSLIEGSFEDYVVTLGLPRNYIKFTKYPFHFHRLLRWIYADYTNRSKLCKTGWKSWQKYSNLKVKTYTDTVYTNNYYCLKCGKKINRSSSVKVIEYVSNMPNTIYLHKTCP